MGEQREVLGLHHKHVIGSHVVYIMHLVYMAGQDCMYLS